MIKLRMDVDYPYASRKQSLLFTALHLIIHNGYLRNSKIIARMVNESPRETKAFWFFTPMTVPDEEMLALMRKRPEKHEACLHVATKPYKELQHLEQVTGQKLRYYTIHGTEKLFGRLIWRRKLNQARVPIPAGFPLKDFWDFPTMQLDVLCYRSPTAKAVIETEKAIAEDKVLHTHPEWLFDRGKMNHRGPYYETLKTVLQVDQDLEGLAIRKRGFARVASYEGYGRFATKEYEGDFVPTQAFLNKLTERGADIYTFFERRWCCPIQNPAKNWVPADDNIAIYEVSTYKAWWEGISKKTRNMIRKAEKSGVTTGIVAADDRLAEGIWKIYNETPIRQGRAFPHYGMPLKQLQDGIPEQKNSTFVGAFIDDELVGFIQLVHSPQLTIISQILSMQKHWDKAINNALVAKAIEVCAEKNVRCVMYGRMGNHPSLDRFKESNSFRMCPLTRYYVPLTRKGKLVIKLGLHEQLRDSLPDWLKTAIYPAFSWVSRTKMTLRLKLHKL